MFSSSYKRKQLLRTFAAVVFVLCSIATTVAQSGEDDIDPVKLFELGQDAHARGEFERALELYGQAIALHPDFPEAEYQRAVAYLSLARSAEAEKSLHRAVALRPEWVAAVSLLGDVMVRQKRFADAEPLLSKALQLEPNNFIALVALAELRLRSKASNEVLTKVLDQIRAATSLPNATVDIWLARGSVERALENKNAALTSYSRALVIDPRNITAFLERAEIMAGKGEIEGAIENAKSARQIAPSSIYVSTALARFYLQAGNCIEATRTLDEVDAVTKRPAETSSLRSAITLECTTGDKETATLEAALTKEPRNAQILARLCLLNRREDPARALEYCRRALEIQPSNVDYATNYAAALVQARRFEAAVTVLRQVIGVTPDKYVAHANLAIALYELKRFPEALVEYKWIRESKPETTATYFFIAVIHDKMGEFENAMSAYQEFLSRADPQAFKLEIEKVNLRLPSLQNQIKLGQGAKKRPQKKT